MESSVWDRLKDFDGYDGVVLDKDEAARLLADYRRVRNVHRGLLRYIQAGGKEPLTIAGVVRSVLDNTPEV